MGKVKHFFVCFEFLLLIIPNVTNQMIKTTYIRIIILAVLNRLSHNGMSIYSGFATRQQQQSYDQCLETVLYILQKRVLRFYRGQPTDEEKFVNLLSKLYSQMKSMESHKYLEPKSSRTFEELLNFLKEKQMEDASILANKLSKVEQIQDSELQKKYPLPIAHPLIQQRQENQGKSQRLQVKFNQMNEQHKDSQKRPNTTNNKIRKRVSSRSNNSNPQVFLESKGNEVASKQSGIATNTGRSQIQNLLNQSASKLVRFSRNEPRSYFNSSHQELQQKNTKGRSMGKDSLDEIQPGDLTGQDNDVHHLIKGYINRTKKSYIKGFNRKKEQIDEMLRQI